MLLQYTDNNSPVLPVEVISQDIPCVGGTQADGEGVEALICCLREAHIVYLGLVNFLADRKPTPVYCGISTVYTAAVCYHGPHGKLNSTIRAWYLTLEAHLVRVSHPRALQRHGLLRHPCPQ